MRISIREFSFYTLSAFFCLSLLSIHGIAQPVAQPVKSPKDEVAEAREKLRAAELAHPGNTVEVADALDYLVGRLVDVEGPSPELLELVKREVAVAEAAAGPRSKIYANALATNSDVYVTLGRPAEGRPLAERAFEIAQKEFPDAPELIEAADELMFACDRLGDYPCAQRAGKVAIAVERKSGPEHEQDLANTLSEVADITDRMGDHTGASVDCEESLSTFLHYFPNDPHLGIFEANIGLHYVRIQEFSKATLHLNRALELNLRNYGPGTGQVNFAILNLADLYSRTGEFPLAWKNFETAIGSELASIDDHATAHSMYARSLASGGNLQRAIQEGVQSVQMARERFVLQARILPERQALSYYEQRPRSMSVID